ncbi:MAG: hypothetical protein EBT95_00105 [Verrucomicrobia bacterium]|nr:hypothetical protein [Verrucomicrobiota bacterium]
MLLDVNNRIIILFSLDIGIEHQPFIVLFVLEMFMEILKEGIYDPVEGRTSATITSTRFSVSNNLSFNVPVGRFSFKGDSFDP